jgi:hypothetical protein
VPSGNASAALNLYVGSNSINVKVTAHDGTTIKTYTITVTRTGSSNADLSTLSISSNNLNPSFVSSTVDYTASVANSTASVTVTAFFADPAGGMRTVQIRVNGGSYSPFNFGSPSPVLALNVGSNLIEIKVTAGDGITTKTYTITVTRAALVLSSNADLMALGITSGSLSPTFISSTTAYAATVANLTSGIKVNSTVADATATVQVRINGGTYAGVTSGINSPELLLNVGSNTIEIKVTAENGTTTKTYTITVTRDGTPRWVGTTSTDWNTASNWNPASVPVSSDPVTIPSGTPNEPNNSGTTAMFSLDIASGATVTNSGTINVKTALTNNGSIIGTGQIILYGGSTQAITGTGTITNLTLNNSSGASISSGMVSITGTLTLTSGILTTGGFLTLKSTATGTARIAAITSGSISGNITQERYIPAKAGRTWSLVASPFTQNIGSAWQQQVHITGAGTGGTVCPAFTAHSNGFDATIANAASMMVYDGTKPVNTRWTSIAGTNAVNLSAGIGYRMNIRGPRSLGCPLLDGTVNTVIAATLSSTGTLSNANKNMGSFTIGLLNNGNATIANDNYLLTGNPYPSQISFSALQTANNGASGINNGYAIYAPGNTVGNYAFWNGSTFTGGNTGLSDATGDIIANGQAFFVQGKLAGADINLNWTEAMKTASVNNGYFRTQSNPNWLRIGYVLANGNKADEIMVEFASNASSTAMNEGDIVSINTGTQNLKSFKAGRELAFNTRNLDFVNDTVMLNVASTSNGNFKLSFYDFDEFAAGTNAKIYLLDKYTGISQLMNANKEYPFTVNTADAASFGAGRFAVVFNKPVPVTIPVAINVKAYPSPFAGQLTVELPQLATGNYTVTLTDMFGRTVLQQQTKNTVVLKTGKLAVGTYLLEVTNPKGEKFTQKIIK